MCVRMSVCVCVCGEENGRQTGDSQADDSPVRDSLDGFRPEVVWEQRLLASSHDSFLVAVVHTAGYCRLSVIAHTVVEGVCVRDMCVCVCVCEWVGRDKCAF